MNKYAIMRHLIVHLRNNLNEGLTPLLSSVTNIIHIYNQNGEIARVEIAEGSQGSKYFLIHYPRDLFDRKVIKINYEWTQNKS